LTHFNAGALAMAQEAFDALADPARRQILKFLADHDEATAGEIAGQVSTIGRTAVSSHLRVLRSAALVTERRDGRFRYYSLDAHGPVRDVLSFLERLLGSSPESLAAAIDAGSERDASSEREPDPRLRRDEPSSSWRKISASRVGPAGPSE
jgi:DNA-binding transcriptional ArsR family regulator